MNRKPCIFRTHTGVWHCTDGLRSGYGWTPRHAYQDWNPTLYRDRKVKK